MFHLKLWLDMAARMRVLWLFAFVTTWMAAAQGAQWQPAQGPLMTRWAKDVKPDKAHPEYPRPQMERKDWLNLNGMWDYAICPRNEAKPSQYEGQILVPFPIESALSGVMKPVSDQQRLWYHRSFTVPSKWKGQRVLLHFGAVDWETVVYVNGKEVGTHRGGYDGFSFDITDALIAGGTQELVVAVFDPTDAGYQPRGKQVHKPNGIWYTPTSGIWQTAWLEPVSAARVESLHIVPSVDDESVTVQFNVKAPGGAVKLEATVLDGRKTVAQASIQDGDVKGAASPRITLKVPQPKLWSPSAPFLYDLKVRVLVNDKVVDEVKSYFGMRKISVAKDAAGTLRLFLNNQALFQYGPLDQGFWPDGLYTAPTDEALRYDIEITKALGFNMARKHVKVEPERWYYWCDKLGLLVWQDMPSGNFGHGDTDKAVSPEATANYRQELKAMIDGRKNHPCIVMWVPFNEGWGQHETPATVEWVKNYDPTRLVNNASGWVDRKVGDVNDIHVYPGPGAPKLEANRAGVLGEFGGLGLPIKGHTWQAEKNWGYRNFKTPDELTDAYLGLMDRLHPLTGTDGLGAAVYTQTTDVEIEVNGLMTYDRALIKMNQALITEANKKLYVAPQPRKTGQNLIPPATPLVACDPYFSIWSCTDRLTDDVTRHWTGRQQSLASMVRIDGKAYRLMGNDPRSVPALEQVALDVLPTRTLYRFEGAGIALSLTFMTPALPYDIDQLSWPVTYVTYDCRSLDGRRHDVSVYFDSSSELTVNDAAQSVTWSTANVDGLKTLKMGSKDQPILGKKGDDLRIDWGYLYLTAPEAAVAKETVAAQRTCRTQFVSEGTLPGMDDRQPRAASDETPVAAMVMNLGRVGTSGASRWLMLAYDDLYSIQYFKKNLRPYWRRNGADAAALLSRATKAYPELLKKCAAFDDEMMSDLRRAGGEKYARLAALAYRQCLAANKIAADEKGQPLMFPKENFSNGCIATVDILYPMAPMYLLLGPSLTKAMLVPIMDYSSSPRWKFPFAPHDLGTYPLANGQVYGGGERTEDNQMPVEETGNMIILMAALAQMEGNADFAGQYWPVLEKWAAYLKDKGFDPENQLCTDDFAGHLAHNVNLSAKAIVALGAYAKLCDMRQDKANADSYRKLASEFAARWVKEAADGDHFRLAFDKAGTWSQKYNLVWDGILSMGLFPEDVLRKEMTFYRKTQQRYGLPLDNRQPYTKLDWTIWTASLTQNADDFQALLGPVYEFLNETSDRVPMNDWYWTQTGRKVGFQARSVVGGVFIKMLYDHATWNKWAKRDATRSAGWAPLPTPPVVKMVVPTAESAPSVWRYTTQKPGANWAQPDFDASSWQEGKSGFGTSGTPGAIVNTVWDAKDIWIRRVVEIPELPKGEMQIRIHHDEDVEVFINGVLAASVRGYTSEYEEVVLNDSARASMRAGKNTIAVHCRQTSGGQYVDMGLVEVVSTKK